MKAIFLVIGIILLGCTKTTPPNNVPKELIGRWEVIEIYETDGGSSANWHEYGSQFDTIPFYIFYDDLTMEKNGKSCNKDSYKYNTSSNILTITTVCQDTFSFIIESLTNDILILDLDFYEPLKLKYKKVY